MAITEAPASRRSAGRKAGRPRFRLDPPPLENGDRLTRLEFGRRYFARPDIGKAVGHRRKGIGSVIFEPAAGRPREEVRR